MDVRAMYGNYCSVCGKPAEVHLGKLGYCLDCYNRLSDYLADVHSPTNDAYQVLALDPEGHAVEFEVQRLALGARSLWTAVEVVPANDPRREWGYVGRKVSVLVDMHAVTQEQALDALSVKVQRVVGRASVDVQRPLGQDASEAALHQPGQTLWARPTGVARIERDEHENTYAVVDGQLLTGDQLLELLSCYEDADLYWQVRDRADGEPDWL